MKNILNNNWHHKILMRGKIGLTIGIILISIATIVLLYNVYYSKNYYISILLAIIVYTLSILSGKNIAYLVHDAVSLRRSTGKNFSPRAMISLWILCLLMVILFYMIITSIFFNSVGLIVASIRSSYAGFIYSLLMFIGAYLLFKYSADKNMDKLYSSWGRNIEKLEKKGKKMINKSFNMIKDFTKL